MRVLLATHNLNLEGAPLFFLEYARYLAAQPGWTVHLISPADGPLRERFATTGVSVELIDLNSAQNATTAADFHTALRALAPKFLTAQYDLIVANTMVAFWGVHLARKLGVPSLLYIHESAPVRRFFAPLLPPVLIPEIEAAFGLAGRVAFIAAVCERKGQHIYVRAIELLEREFARSDVTLPPRHYLMVGGREGIYLDSLQHDIALRHLANIEIIPEVDDPFAYYGAADVFVCSSFEEAFPRVLLEAAVFGLPIASTDVNGVPEMLGPDDAWLCPPGDPARLATAMCGAIDAARTGDHTRVLRAKTAVITRFDARTNLPIHLALARTTARRLR